jgi:hypothetical protein
MSILGLYDLRNRAYYPMMGLFYQTISIPHKTSLARQEQILTARGIDIFRFCQSANVSLARLDDSTATEQFICRIVQGFVLVRA